jgi:hypothetical protein
MKLQLRFKTNNLYIPTFTIGILHNVKIDYARNIIYLYTYGLFSDDSTAQITYSLMTGRFENNKFKKLERKHPLLNIR